MEVVIFYLFLRFKIDEWTNFGKLHLFQTKLWNNDFNVNFSPAGNSRCQGFILEKNLMPVTFVANINILTGENHMCVKFVVLFKLMTEVMQDIMAKNLMLT